MLNAVPLPPTPFFPGTVLFPVMALFMRLYYDPGQEASSKKALSQVSQLLHWPAHTCMLKGV